MSTERPLLRVRGLRKHFVTGGSWLGSALRVRAVDGIDFDLQAGETLALVGESGCGKTTVGRALLRLLDAVEGQVLYQPSRDEPQVDLLQLTPRQLRPYRRQMQVVFQDPFSSLNPRLTAGRAIGEALQVHGLARGREREERVAELLVRVGLSPEMAGRFPHEFSGGQRQRIGIARALAVEPRWIVCDEALSALDVSVQAQILNLLGDLQRDLGLAYLFISHDLSVVRHIADRVAVMYLGRIVEIGPVERIFEVPQHPYTQALLSAIPVPDPKLRGSRDRVRLEGDPPSAVDPPSGCAFRTRCPLAQESCGESRPELESVGPEHQAACLLLPR